MGLRTPRSPTTALREFLSTPQVIAKWRGIDGCTQQSQVANVQKAKVEIWQTCKAKTAVELVTVIGGGHGWQKSPTFDTGGAVWRFFAAHPQASTTPAAALTGSCWDARIAYKPTRRVLVRVNIGQASSVQMTLLRSKRAIATRTIPSAKAGVSNVVLHIPRSAKAGDVHTQRHHSSCRFAARAHAQALLRR